MRESKRLALILAVAGMLAFAATPADARTRKGDQLYSRAHAAEVQKKLDEALDLYEEALAQDPAEVVYQMAVRRMRFQASQEHVDAGTRLRSEGKLADALAEYQKAYGIDPSSPIAAQELRRTEEMIEADRKRATPAPAEEKGLTPSERARREADERIQKLMSVPTLRPTSTAPIKFTANNRTPREIVETVCKMAGINVIFDSDQTGQISTKPISVEFANATIEEVLNYVALQAKIFWKPVSANGIFVTLDSPVKRRDVEELVTKVFYLNNIGEATDLNELRTMLTTVIGATHLTPVASQGAIIMRDTADKVALAEMLLRNLDRPKPEVVVDVLLMEVSRNASRKLGLSPVSGTSNGISVPLVYSPREGVASEGSTAAVSLANLSRTSSADFQVTIPGAQLQALLSDSNSRVLQSPQVRTIDGKKATLKIGAQEPYSSGGYQPTATTGVAMSGLYNNFQFKDTGVTVELTPKVHGNDEVTLHVVLTIASLKERIEIAGISQPVFTNRNIEQDIRLKEGEVNLMGGLTNHSESKSVSGVPVLSSVPVLGRLFSQEVLDKSDSELFIAIIPRVVRAPELDDINFKGVAAGSETTVRLMYEPRQQQVTAAEAKPAARMPASAVTPESLMARTVVPAAVLFNPVRVNAAAGQMLTLSLQVQNAADLFSAPMRLKFDPKVLQLNDVIRGDFLSGDGREVLFTRNITNNTGDANITLRRQEGAGGISGSGILVTFSFQVIGSGVTTVTAPQITFQDSQGKNVFSGSPQSIVTIR
jgi:general secretion pathway protein D